MDDERHNKRNKKKLLFTSLSRYISIKNNRNMIGTKASMDMMSHKLRKMGILKKNLEVKLSPNEMEIKRVVITMVKKVTLLRVATWLR